jgi:DNA polymerase III subunit beta
MKFFISRETLLTPLQQIVSVIEKRQTMPILANVLVDIQPGILTLTGTDLEIQLVMSTALSDDVQDVGAVTVPARKFLDICRLLPAGAHLLFEHHDGKIKLVANKSKFSLSSLPADNYPEFMESAFEQQFIVNAAQLKKALEKTVFCMANQDVRYYLNGLLLHISNQSVNWVASDGHRLAIYEDHLDQPTGIESRMILPRKGVMELLRLLDNSNAALTVEFSANNIRISSESFIFSAKLVDSKYPDFGKVFQQQSQCVLKLAKNSLKEALTRVAILANEKFKGVTLDISSNSLKISTHNPEHEEAEEELTIEYDGEPFGISFNVQYLLDAFNNISSDIVALMITQNANTCFIEEPGESPYKFIVMPMKL